MRTSADHSSSSGGMEALIMSSNVHDSYFTYKLSQGLLHRMQRPA